MTIIPVMSLFSKRVQKIMFFLLFTAIALAGCAGSEEKEKEIRFEMMYNEYYAPFPEKKFIIIQDEKDFKDFINETGMIFKPVDFEKYTVIALFMGEQKKGGYAITVDRIVEENGAVKIYVKNLVPSETCLVTQVITRPFQIIKAEKITGNIEFVESVEEVSC